THRQEDAVGRGAVYLEGAVVPAEGPERPVEGERVGGAALLPVRRDHGHLPHFPADLREQRDSRGEDAVVIAHQDVHGDAGGAAPSRSCSTSSSCSWSSRSVAREAARAAWVLSSPLRRYCSIRCRAPSMVYFSA